jgi:hypothetical protein
MSGPRTKVGNTGRNDRLSFISCVFVGVLTLLLGGPHSGNLGAGWIAIGMIAAVGWALALRGVQPPY